MSPCRSMPTLPLEVIREIFDVFYGSQAPPPLTRVYKYAEIGVSAALPWRSLASLLAVSKAYREIAIEAWLRTLTVRSPADLEAGLQLFPAMGTRTRYLHCLLTAPWGSKLFDLRDFQKLKAIRVDHIHNVDLPVHSGPWGFLNAKDLSPFQIFQNLPPSIQEFHISSRTPERFPSLPTTFLSAQAFRNLKVLSLRMQNSWCDLCSSDQELVLEKPFPGRIVYEGGIGLPLKFGEALLGMKQLETVLLAVAIHRRPNIHRTPRPRPLIMTPRSGSLIRNAIGENGLLWSGECVGCVETFQVQEDFRLDWVKLKKGEGPMTSGLVDGLKHRFHRIPSLKRVEWYFIPPAGRKSERSISVVTILR